MKLFRIYTYTLLSLRVMDYPYHMHTSYFWQPLFCSHFTLFLRLVRGLFLTTGWFAYSNPSKKLTISCKVPLTKRTGYVWFPYCLHLLVMWISDFEYAQDQSETQIRITYGPVTVLTALIFNPNLRARFRILFHCSISFALVMPLPLLFADFLSNHQSY